MITHSVINARRYDLLGLPAVKAAPRAFHLDLGAWPAGVADRRQTGVVSRFAYASRVRTTRQVRVMRAAASAIKMVASMPWKAQNLLSGW